MQGVDLFITITDRSRAEQFAAWFRTHGISLVLTALGQGTATTEVLDFLGLEATEKAVLFCVSPRSPRLVRQAARDLWLDVPGQGVLMTVPVNSIGGSTAKEYLLHEQEGETAMEREIAHDLIVVIANQGSTDLVMDAAREAGATGGTVIHAKGTGTDLVRKFFGVSIASEQEMVFILARSEAKKPIMKAIMAKAGIQSAAQSLVCWFLNFLQNLGYLDRFRQNFARPLCMIRAVPRSCGGLERMNTKCRRSPRNICCSSTPSPMRRNPCAGSRPG